MGDFAQRAHEAKEMLEQSDRRCTEERSTFDGQRASWRDERKQLERQLRAAEAARGAAETASSVLEEKLSKVAVGLEDLEARNARLEEEAAEAGRRADDSHSKLANAAREGERLREAGRASEKLARERVIRAERELEMERVAGHQMEQRFQEARSRERAAIEQADEV